VTGDRDPTTRGHPSVFADVAGAYERGRPGYPEDAVRWLAGDEPRDVVDLGAGTGKLSRALVALGHRVMAIEPLPQMLEHLADNAPGAFGVLGTAEVIPLPDAFADVVTSAQSFHWFDHEVALPEIARVLRPEGRLAVVWNIRDDDDPFMARLSALIGNERLNGQVWVTVVATGIGGSHRRAFTPSFAAATVSTRSTSRDDSELPSFLQ